MWLVATLLDSTDRDQLVFYESAYDPFICYIDLSIEPTGFPQQMIKFTYGQKHEVTF